MKRRDFIIILSGAAAAWPFATRAQEAGRVYRLGGLSAGPRDAPYFLAMFENLRRLGFIEGQNLTVYWHSFALHVDRVSDFAADLVKANVDAILASGDLATRAAQGATQSIPILATSDDMVRSGLVNSLARPEGNTTGISMFSTELDGKRQEILIEVVPGLRRMAALADSATTALAQLQALQDAARTRNVELSIQRIARPEEIAAAIDAAKAWGAAALNVLASPVLFGNRQIVLERVAALRLPAIELIDELREALGGVRLNNKLRAEISEIADTLQSNLDKVVQHGKRADAIVKNMLLHSRQGSGEHRPVDINALVDESLNLAYHGARAERQGFNITLERSFDPAAGDIDLFPQEITRALLNLISNGFYATTKRKAEADGGNYEPTVAAATKNLGDRVEIRIRDNGTGIPPEVREKLFNPFFTTKPAGEGTGLGLSISHDIIVKQHGGSIEVDTQPGEFTEFRIVLPRASASPL